MQLNKMDDRRMLLGRYMADNHEKEESRKALVSLSQGKKAKVLELNVLEVKGIFDDGSGKAYIDSEASRSGVVQIWVYWDGRDALLKIANAEISITMGDLRENIRNSKYLTPERLETSMLDKIASGKELKHIDVEMCRYVSEELADKAQSFIDKIEEQRAEAKRLEQELKEANRQKEAKEHKPSFLNTEDGIKYMNALEKELIEKGEIPNISDKYLFSNIVLLFERYDFTIPYRTKGHINSEIKGIYYDCDETLRYETDDDRTPTAKAEVLLENLARY